MLERTECPYQSSCLLLNRTMKRLETLLSENILLRKTLREYSKYFQIPETLLKYTYVEEEKEEPWTEKSRKFTAIKKLILKIVLDQFTKTGAPQHYSTIWKIFTTRHPEIKLSDQGIETVGRICRMLRQEGYLASPRKGYYAPGEKMKMDKTMQDSLHMYTKEK